MTPAELAAIRERDAAMQTGRDGLLNLRTREHDRRALLALVDELTERAETAEAHVDRCYTELHGSAENPTDDGWIGRATQAEYEASSLGGERDALRAQVARLMEVCQASIKPGTHPILINMRDIFAALAQPAAE